MQINGEKLLELIDADIEDTKRIRASGSSWNLMVRNGFVVTINIESVEGYYDNLDLDGDEEISTEYGDAAIEK